LLQTGQCEEGEMMDFLSGMRTMQTLRKLPMAEPVRKRNAGMSQLIMHHNPF
jgi:hypothetical protein